jgi:hypothetical protein
MLPIQSDTQYEKTAYTILYELWYSIGETIFNRVCELAELDDEQRLILRSIALRPNTFQVIIE